MNIGFDAKRAFHNFSGLGNYSRLLIQSLSELYSHNQYFLYTPKYKPHPLHNFAKSKNCHIKTPVGLTSLFPSSLWRTFSISKVIHNQKIDIFHGLSGELPVSNLKMPKVVTIHDVIFMRNPEYYSIFDRKIYEMKFKYACKIANKIITVSKQTADDCIHFLNADPKKIEIGYQSCDPIFWTFQPEKNIIKEYQLPEKFILSVGTIEARKNLLNLVKALKFIDEDISLVAIGGKTSYTTQVENYIEENKLAHRVILLHKVPFCDFPSIYASASAFVYPSVFEGFGIPVLEALVVGTPVATSNCSSMPEVGGEAALYFNPENVEEIADRVNVLLHNKATVAKLNERRTKQLDKFSIENIARKVNEVYESL